MTGGPVTYPQTYTYGPGARLAWSGLSLAFLLPGLIGIGLFCAAVAKPGWVSFLKLANPTITAPILAGLCVLPAALGIICLFSTLRGKLTLYSDRLEYTGVWSQHMIRREQILETRNVRHQYGFWMLTLILNTPNAKKITITDFGKADDAFVEWFNDIPNAEGRAEQAKNDKLLANSAFGTTPEARERAINAQTRLLSILFFVPFGVAMWGLFYPHPYDACIAALVAIPIFSVVAALASNGKWSLVEDSNSGRLSLADWMTFPIAILGLRAYRDNEIIDWQPSIFCAAVATPILVGLVAVVDRRLALKTTGIAAIFCAGYAWACLVQANYLFDSTDPKVIPVHILDMHRETGRHQTSYLTLPSWGTKSHSEDYAVSFAFYQRLHKGDIVCIYVYPGAFEWASYDVDTCTIAKH